MNWAKGSRNLEVSELVWTSTFPNRVAKATGRLWSLFSEGSIASLQPHTDMPGGAHSIECCLSSGALTAAVEHRLWQRQNLTAGILRTIAELKHACRTAKWRHLISFDKSNDLEGSIEKWECSRWGTNWTEQGVRTGAQARSPQGHQLASRKCQSLHLHFLKITFQVFHVVCFYTHIWMECLCLMQTDCSMVLQ